VSVGRRAAGLVVAPPTRLRPCSQMWHLHTHVRCPHLQSRHISSKCFSLSHKPSAALNQCKACPWPTQGSRHAKKQDAMRVPFNRTRALSGKRPTEHGRRVRGQRNTSRYSEPRSLSWFAHSALGVSDGAACPMHDVSLSSSVNGLLPLTPPMFTCRERGRP